jgi:hypothetical protein
VEIFPLEVPSRNELPDSLGTVERTGQVLQGVVSDNNCRTDPCFNGGNCTITWNDFQSVFVIFVGLSMSFNRDRFLHKGASARRDSKGKRALSWNFAPFISAQLVASATT